MVSAVTDEVLAAGGAFSLVPVNRGPMWAWGWMPGVVAMSAAAHPELMCSCLVPMRLEGYGSCKLTGSFTTSMRICWTFLNGLMFGHGDSTVLRCKAHSR